jgi:hypothetical protein
LSAASGTLLIWAPDIDYTCKINPGLDPADDYYPNERCNYWSLTYDKVTKDCVSCPVPGLASINPDGWTKTTYPVETCTPCNAAKNEYPEWSECNAGNGFSCIECFGVIKLSGPSVYFSKG